MQVLENDLRIGYKNLDKALTRYLHLNNLSFKASSNAPKTFKGIKASFERLGELVVYNGGDHGFLGKNGNTKFRAVHDHGHIAHNLSFKFAEEKQLSKIQAKELVELVQGGISEREATILGLIVDAEIRGQIEFYEKHGEFVLNQKDFIREFFSLI